MIAKALLTLVLAGWLAPSASALQLADSFVERALELGIDHQSLGGFDNIGPTKAISDWVQTGIAIGDIDGDGDPDVVLCGGLLGDTILQNNGAAGFLDVTALSGVEHNELGRMPALGDYDNDGDLDLYIAALIGGEGPTKGRSMLWRNNGVGHFEDVTDVAGVAGRGRSLFAQWYDIDRDGLLDIYVCEFDSTNNLYYRNNGDGSFTESGKNAGVNWPGSAHASAILDSDGDGGLDIFIGNDWLAAFLVGMGGNQGDGQLAGAPAASNAPYLDVTSGSGLDVHRGIMGLAWGDPDYDGDLDLYKTDVGPNFFFINHGWPSTGQPWTQGQVSYGIGAGTSPWHEFPGTFGLNSSWAPLFFSADFDLWDDFYVTQGHVAGLNPALSYLTRDEPDNFYWGVGPAMPFVEDAVGAGLYVEVDNRGLAAGDMDADGDLDLFTTATAGRTRYFENQIDPDGQGWLQVVAETHTSAPGGAGTIVRFTDSSGFVHTRALGADGPTASQHQVLAHFGLGNETSVDVDVTFPSGITQSYPGTLPNTRFVAVEPKLFELSSPVLPVQSEAPVGLDRLTVDVWAHDATGMPLDATAIVLIDIVGLNPLGPVQSLGGNHFQREFDLATLPELYRVDLMFNGWAPEVLPNVRFRGGPSPTETTSEVHPAAVRAGSSDALTIVAVPRDAFGLLIGSGLPILIELPAALPLGPTVDVGDGRYQRRFRAPVLPGNYSTQISIGGLVLPNTSTFEAGAAAAESKTELQQYVPLTLQAASPDELRVLVVPRDSNGRHLGPGAQVELEVVPSPPPGSPVLGTGRVPVAPGSVSTSSLGGTLGGTFGGGAGGGSTSLGGTSLWPEVRLRSDVDSSGQEDGEFYFSIAKTPGMPEALPSGTLVLRVDGVFVTSVPFSF